jgi:hypothetical protein
MSGGTVNVLLALIAGVVVLSTVIGAVDLVRQPGWAWRAAGEPKALCLLLVLLLPGVGLAIYVFGARPKVVAVATAGRAANLPFERFGDREALAEESVRAVHAMALPTALGSFGELRPVRTIRTSEPGVAPVGARFTDSPPAEVDAPAGDPDPAAAVATVAGSGSGSGSGSESESESEMIRIPGGFGRPYRPRQRTSFGERDTMHAVAAQILGATGESAPGSPGDPAPSGPGAAPGVGVLSMAGAPSTPVAAGSSVGPATGGPLPRLGIPLATPSAPELFRPRPQTVAPLAFTPVAAAGTAPRLTARWMPDPTCRHQYRYWDGGSWTQNVYDAGVESRDPVAD